MADSERFHVKLGLSGTYWDRRPEYEVVFNSKIIHKGCINVDSDQVEYIEFDIEYETESAELAIRLFNKLPTDTVLSEDKAVILKDMLLNIVSLEMDEIDIKSLLHSKSKYHTDYPVKFQDQTTQLVTECVNLGWNGTWKLTWTNPFYIWLLENL